MRAIWCGIARRICPQHACSVSVRACVALMQTTHFFIDSGEASLEKPSGSKKPSGAQSPTMPSIFIEIAGAAERIAAPMGAEKPELQAGLDGQE